MPNSTKPFDVFLSHSHSDSEFVKQLAEKLEDDHGVKPWVDQWELVPGQAWVQGMARGLDQAASCAVCLGSNMPAGWFQREIGRALNRQTQEPRFGVIPVLLPGGDPATVNDFVELNTWVDFRNGLSDEEAMRRLVSGIQGLPPGRGTNKTEEVSTEAQPPRQSPRVTLEQQSVPTVLTGSETNRVPQHARVALGAFVCCFVVLVLLMFSAEKLAPFGLIERVYYLVLVLMGITAAVFLFGVLPSRAEYEGKLLGGTLKLSGAVVGAALVVVGGYYFAPSATTFPLTVYVHGEAGPQDTVLQNSGSVVLLLGPERKTAQIRDGGQAYFPAIPSDFRGQNVLAWVDSDEFESVGPRTKQPLTGSVLSLTVRKTVRHFTLAGTITDQATGDPLQAVHVSVPEYHAENDTDASGRFELQVPAESQRMVDLIAQKPGYHTEQLSRTLGDTGVNFSLQRSK